MENLIIGILFIGAVVYLGKQLREHFSPKNVGCAKGCGGACATKFEFTTIDSNQQEKK